ncbi:MAG: ECF transporter S component [Oscillospiraceae bacterium]|nr:ECF transporter S component [Oscillospiraceae bacterium]
MQNTRTMTTKRLVINAVLVAIYVVLRFFNIPIGNSFRFTLASFSVVLCALLYGPVDGLLVGLLGEFLSQVLGPYGLTPTTLLWCVGETVRGGALGLCAVLFLRKGLLSGERPQPMCIVSTLLCCVLTGVLAALGQTFALYVDSKMFGYYSDTIVFGVMVWRILIYMLLAGMFGYLSLPIISALKKAKFV